MATTISIEQAHERYYGAQDSYNAADFVGAGPHTVAVQGHVDISVSEGRNRVEVINEHDIYGAANLRITGNWISAGFEVGGQRFEKIYPFMGTNEFWYTRSGRAFPRVSFHSLRIEIEAGPGGATISWDKVSVEEKFNGSDARCDIYAVAPQYTGEEILTRNESDIRLRYNHPVFAIYVRTDKPVQGLSLQVNEYALDAPFIWDAENDQWACVFQEIPEDGVPISSSRTINFSRIDRAILRVHHDHDEVRVDTWATNGHLTRIMSGMAGLAFCS